MYIHGLYKIFTQFKKIKYKKLKILELMSDIIPSDIRTFVRVYDTVAQSEFFQGEGVHTYININILTKEKNLVYTHYKSNTLYNP